MESWFIYTLLATLLYGVLNFLYKAAAERGHDADGLVNIVGLTVAGLAFGSLLATTPRPLAAITVPVLGYALFNGLFFALGALAKVGALKRAPAAVVFPLYRLNSVGVMMIGFVFFREVPRPVQVLGVLAGLGALGVVALESRTGPAGARGAVRAGGILLALAGALCTALSMTVGKLLADTSANRLAYIAVSYSLVFLFTWSRDAWRRRRLGWLPHRFGRGMALFGAAIGALNFIGYFLVLQAFGSGPISLSQAIFGSSILIPVLLSRVVYREKISRPQLAAIGLALLSMVLIGLR